MVHEPARAGDGPDDVTVGDARLELRRGDITRQPDLDAVTNAANAQLAPGGGVAGAIHRAAGPALADACTPLAPILPGECVVTDAFDLPNRAVVHALGPVHGQDEPAAELLASCYRRALGLVADRGLTSIGFPALSTGVFGYPVDEAAEVAIGTVLDTLASDQRIRLVRFVLFSEGDLDANRRALAARLDPGA